MPQFVVYRNPAPSRTTPFVVQVQSTRLDDRVGRVVLPLVRRSPAAPAEHALTPYLTVLGEALYANPLDLATIAAKRLGAPVGVLSDTDQDLVAAAIDQAISRA